MPSVRAKRNLLNKSCNDKNKEKVIDINIQETANKTIKHCALQTL